MRASKKRSVNVRRLAVLPKKAAPRLSLPQRSILSNI